jgi:hypothetical protein
MYAIVTGSTPFYDDDDKVLVKKIKSGAFDTTHDGWKSLSEEA